MRTFIKSLFWSSLFCLSFFSLSAQDDVSKRYYAMDYMKVKPDMQEEYLKLEKVCNIGPSFDNFSQIKVKKKPGKHLERQPAWFVQNFKPFFSQNFNSDPSNQ